MIKNADVAASVNQSLQDAFHILGESMVRVRRNCSEAEAASYGERIGDIFYIITFKLLEPLYEEHPQLKPPAWDRDPSPQE
jgi:hypothetical protein